MKLFNRRVFLKRSAFAAGGLTGVISGLRTDSLFAGYPASEETSDRLIARLARIRSSHPSLHFNAEGQEKLRRLAGGTHRRYAGILFEWADRNRKFSPSEMLERSANEVTLEQCGAFVTNAALAFVVSRRDEYLQLSRRWAMEMCEYPLDEVDNYGFGIYAAGLARAYDWLYRDLTVQQRKRIRTSIVNLVGQLYQRSFPGSRGEYWWAQAYIHHDHWVPVGG